MSAAPLKILVVDDEPPIRKLLRMGLSTQGYEILEAPTGKASLDLLARNPDLIILDLGLPDIEGLELLRMIRARNEGVPIVVLSSRGDEVGKVQALDLGADDYITKPFGVEELLARITATLRRTRPAAESPVGSPTVITVGDVVIDLEAQLVTRGGAAVHLTPTEFHLLRELALNRGRLLSHATLLRRVWGVGYETETEYIRVYIGRLRSKLEGPECPSLITTEPRAGYRLVAD